MLSRLGWRSEDVGSARDEPMNLVGQIEQPLDLMVVLSGSVDMDIDGDKRTCVKGDIIHVPANAVHSAEVPAGEDYYFITAKDTSWGIQGTPVKG